MNLSEALDAALPEIPRNRISRKNPPRIDPDLITREDVTDGETIVSVYQRSSASLMRMKPTQWQLACLFDGVRSYEEIAAAFEAESGIPISPEEARTFAENMDEGGFWYKNPQEKNLAMNEKLHAHRSRRASGETFNVAHIQFSAWDPDRYLTWLDKKIGHLVYSRWTAICALLLFLIEGAIFAANWKVMGPDILLFYDFSKKTFADLAEFWMLMMVVGFIHETAHGLTCKHYGGEVHSMGLMFIYLAPCFYVDVTESWVMANRMQRLATIIAGIWVELIMCGLATLMWVSTQPGEWIHDFCYYVILLTGVAVAVINMNPLIKLDGYYFFTEIVRVPDLKERSTSFVLGWVQRHIFRLPVDVPVVSRRRLPLFVVYALVSGAYSYLLLFLFIRFSYNVLYHWLAELAVVPVGMIALWIFRARLRSLRTFTLNFFRTHAAHGVFRPTPWKAAAAFALLIILFAPVFRDRQNAWFVIEPRESWQVHAGVPGRVQAVYTREGDAVSSGQVLARLESLSEAGANEKAAAAMAASQAHVYTAELRHSGLGEALAEHRGAQLSSAIAHDEEASLAVTAPASGVVSTIDPQNLVNRNVATGEVLVTIVNPLQLVARLYIPASEMQWVRSGDEVSLQPRSQFEEIRGSLGVMEGAAVSMPAGLMDRQEYRGMVLPVFYTTLLSLREHDDRIQMGMSGPAKIFGRRRSLAERVVAKMGNMLHSHFW